MGHASESRGWVRTAMQLHREKKSERTGDACTDSTLDKACAAAASCAAVAERARHTGDVERAMRCPLLKAPPPRERVCQAADVKGRCRTVVLPSELLQGSAAEMACASTTTATTATATITTRLARTSLPLALSSTDDCWDRHDECESPTWLLSPVPSPLHSLGSSVALQRRHLQRRPRKGLACGQTKRPQLLPSVHDLLVQTRYAGCTAGAKKRPCRQGKLQTAAPQWQADADVEFIGLARGDLDREKCYRPGFRSVCANLKRARIDRLSASTMPELAHIALPTK
ncbi:hypothetical protein DIPPA_07004 [Diplonema papillatum]|nr:hypothetical protein DIPPA_12154 [Diplonema papillatum]KAJ9446884.1 hypothetical protein DIPPA_07004 [Diplonema papillatum]